jgi:hypothetical protein
MRVNARVVERKTADDRLACSQKALQAGPRTFIEGLTCQRHQTKESLQLCRLPMWICEPCSTCTWTFFLVQRAAGLPWISLNGQAVMELDGLWAGAGLLLGFMFEGDPQGLC